MKNKGKVAFGISGMEWRAIYFRKLLFEANDEKFSLRKVKSKKICRHCRRKSLSCILPARRCDSAGLCESNVSVRPSVTRRYCVKTKKASVMISSLSGSSMIHVFWCQNSSQNSKGVTPSDGVKPGWGRQNKNFSSFERQYLEIRSKLLLISNRKLIMSFRLAARLMTLDDLELLQVRIVLGISCDFVHLEVNNG